MVMISRLQQKDLDAQIRAMTNIGGSKIARLKAALANGVDTLHTRWPPATPSHALSQACFDFMKQDAQNWKLEDGFPCQHRLPRRYFFYKKKTQKPYGWYWSR
jgi:hypothetical protein